jgi:hypothetical protein
MEVELDPLTLLEMGMGEDNIEIEVNFLNSLTSAEAKVVLWYLSLPE